MRQTFGIFAIVAVNLLASHCPAEEPAQANLAAAERYLVDRAEWWLGWKPAQRDFDTSCQSCHTTAPFILAHTVLKRTNSTRPGTTSEEVYGKILASVRRRVEKWPELKPEDADSTEALRGRGTESVLNLLALAEDDAANLRTSPSEAARQAVKQMWEQQVADDPARGAWPWFEFKLAPWEADAQYWGAALAAYSLGTLPGYLADLPTEDRERIDRLQAYLRDNLASQSLHHQLAAVWAASRWPGLLSAGEQQQVIERVMSQQNADGGWSSGSLLGEWKNQQGELLPTASDGYGTAVVVASLRAVAKADQVPSLERGRNWLRANQSADGSWPAESANRARGEDEPERLFMRDAATAWAVAALEP